MLCLGKLEVSTGFILAAAALFYLDTENILPWAALSGGLHELGHWLVTRAFGGRVQRLRLTAVGGDMHLDQKKPLTYGGELAAILAGPAMNLIAATVAAQFFPGERGWLFAGLNLSLGVFNLLPVVPLDGGRALFLILDGLFSEPWASRFSGGVSTITAAALLTAGLVLLRRTGGNFTLLLVALWLSAGLLLDGGNPPPPRLKRRKAGYRSGASQKNRRIL